MWIDFCKIVVEYGFSRLTKKQQPHFEFGLTRRKEKGGSIFSGGGGWWWWLFLIGCIQENASDWL